MPDSFYPPKTLAQFAVSSSQDEFARQGPLATLPLLSKMSLIVSVLQSQTSQRDPRT